MVSTPLLGLAWLARQMTAHHKSELHLEQLRLDWLPKGQRASYQWSIVLVFGLLSWLAGRPGAIVRHYILHLWLW